MTFLVSVVRESLRRARRVATRNPRMYPRGRFRNNVAEYLGLEAGLRAYLAAGGRGPLRIIGDSKVVIGHIEKRRDRGLWPDKPHLAARCRAVFALLDQIGGDWTIGWRSQEENSS